MTGTRYLFLVLLFMASEFVGCHGPAQSERQNEQENVVADNSNETQSPADCKTADAQPSTQDPVGEICDLLMLEAESRLSNEKNVSDLSQDRMRVYNQHANTFSSELNDEE